MNKYLYILISEDGFEVMRIQSAFTTLNVESYYETYLKKMVQVLRDQMEEFITYKVEVLS